MIEKGVRGHENWRESGYTRYIVLQPCFRIFPEYRIYRRRDIYYFLIVSRLAESVYDTHDQFEIYGQNLFFLNISMVEYLSLYYDYPIFVFCHKYYYYY